MKNKIIFNPLISKYKLDEMLSTGNAKQLSMLITEMMNDYAGDHCFKKLAIEMISALLETLVSLRDNGKLCLDIASIHKYLYLDQMVRLSLRKDVEENSLLPIKNYILEKLKCSKDICESGKIPTSAYETHGYSVMQFTEILSVLESVSEPYFTDEDLKKHIRNFGTKG